jgi:hypothetical protein
MKARTIVGSMFVLAGMLTLFACTSSTTSSNSDGAEAAQKECTEPENPYDEGTGHYAGYEWAEQNSPSACGGRSQSFIEGCEEYQQQESEYEDCETRRK